jgi:hypothetical protein
VATGGSGRRRQDKGISRPPHGDVRWGRRRGWRVAWPKRAESAAPGRRRAGHRPESPGIHPRLVRGCTLVGANPRPASASLPRETPRPPGGPFCAPPPPGSPAASRAAGPSLVTARRAESVRPCRSRAIATAPPTSAAIAGGHPPAERASLLRARSLRPDASDSTSTGMAAQPATPPTAPPQPAGAPPLPSRIGPVEFGILGRMVALRSILMQAGAMWEPGSRRWLVER